MAAQADYQDSVLNRYRGAQRHPPAPPSRVLHYYNAPLMSLPAIMQV